MTAPLFSVLVATYNQSGYILETLESVADQTFGDFEIVIVDDGSTDDTEPKVRRWLELFRDRRSNQARLVTIPNSGQSAALEHGFSFCSGEYVCLLDSDDRWLPEKLAACAEAIEFDSAAGMIVHPLLVIDPEGRRTGDTRPMRARLSAGDLGPDMRRGMRHVAPPTSGVVIRRDVFQRLLPMPTKGFTYGADTYLTFGASLLSPVHALEEPLGEYRLNPRGQYLQRMLSPEGLVRSVEHLRVIAEHFGLRDMLRDDSWAARSIFAASKLGGAPPEQVASFARLIRATVRDPSFGSGAKALFVGFWALCLLSPKPLFRRLWRSFQLRHTGYDRLIRPRLPAEGPR